MFNHRDTEGRTSFHSSPQSNGVIVLLETEAVFCPGRSAAKCLLLA